jgi:hypothetical protein
MLPNATSHTTTEEHTPHRPLDRESNFRREEEIMRLIQHVRGDGWEREVQSKIDHRHGEGWFGRFKGWMEGENDVCVDPAPPLTNNVDGQNVTQRHEAVIRYNMGNELRRRLTRVGWKTAATAALTGGAVIAAGVLTGGVAWGAGIGYSLVGSAVGRGIAEGIQFSNGKERKLRAELLVARTRMFQKGRELADRIPSLGAAPQPADVDSPTAEERERITEWYTNRERAIKDLVNFVATYEQNNVNVKTRTNANGATEYYTAANMHGEINQPMRPGDADAHGLNGPELGEGTEVYQPSENAPGETYGEKVLALEKHKKKWRKIEECLAAAGGITGGVVNFLTVKARITQELLEKGHVAMDVDGDGIKHMVEFAKGTAHSVNESAHNLTYRFNDAAEMLQHQFAPGTPLGGHAMKEGVASAIRWAAMNATKDTFAPIILGLAARMGMAVPSIVGDYNETIKQYNRDATDHESYRRRLLPSGNLADSGMPKFKSSSTQPSGGGSGLGGGSGSGGGGGGGESYTPGPNSTAPSGGGGTSPENGPSQPGGTPPEARAGTIPELHVGDVQLLNLRVLPVRLQTQQGGEYAMPVIVSADGQQLTLQNPSAQQARLREIHETPMPVPIAIKAVEVANGAVQYVLLNSADTGAKVNALGADKFDTIPVVGAVNQENMQKGVDVKELKEPSEPTVGTQWSMLATEIGRPIQLDNGQGKFIWSLPAGVKIGNRYLCNGKENMESPEQQAELEKMANMPQTEFDNAHYYMKIVFVGESANTDIVAVDLVLAEAPAKTPAEIKAERVQERDAEIAEESVRPLFLSGGKMWNNGYENCWRYEPEERTASQLLAPNQKIVMKNDKNIHVTKTGVVGLGKKLRPHYINDVEVVVLGSGKNGQLSKEEIKSLENNPTMGVQIISETPPGVSADDAKYDRGVRRSNGLKIDAVYCKLIPQADSKAIEDEYDSEMEFLENDELPQANVNMMFADGRKEFKIGGDSYDYPISENVYCQIGLLGRPIRARMGGYWKLPSITIAGKEYKFDPKASNKMEVQRLVRANESTSKYHLELSTNGTFGTDDETYSYKVISPRDEKNRDDSNYEVNEIVLNDQLDEDSDNIGGGDDEQGNRKEDEPNNFAVDVTNSQHVELMGLKPSDKVAITGLHPKGIIFDGNNFLTIKAGYLSGKIDSTDDKYQFKIGLPFALGNSEQERKSNLEREVKQYIDVLLTQGITNCVVAPLSRISTIDRTVFLISEDSLSGEPGAEANRIFDQISSRGTLPPSDDTGASDGSEPNGPDGSEKALGGGESGEAKEKVAKLRTEVERLVHSDKLEPKEKYMASIDAAIEVLKKESGVVELARKDVPTIVVSDLHARKEFIGNLLLGEYQGEPVLDLLAQGRLNIVCVGDGLHTERSENWDNDDMNKEMAAGLNTMAIVMELKTMFPNNFHFLRGNHDDVDGLDFAKNVKEPGGESRKVREWMKQYGQGFNFLDAYRHFESQLPYIVTGRDYLIEHSAPGGESGEAWELPSIDKIRAKDDAVKLNLTWTDNAAASHADMAEIARLSASLKSELGLPANAKMFIGHRNSQVDGKLYRSQYNGELIQVNDDKQMLITIIPPDGSFDPDKHVIAFNGTSVRGADFPRPGTPTVSPAPPAPQSPPAQQPPKISGEEWPPVTPIQQEAKEPVEPPPADLDAIIGNALKGRTARFAQSGMVPAPGEVPIVSSPEEAAKVEDRANEIAIPTGNKELKTYIEDLVILGVQVTGDNPNNLSAEQLLVIGALKRLVTEGDVSNENITQHALEAMYISSIASDAKVVLGGQVSFVQKGLGLSDMYQELSKYVLSLGDEQSVAAEAAPQPVEVPTSPVEPAPAPAPAAPVAAKAPEVKPAEETKPADVRITAPKGANVDDLLGGL